jgi:type IV pilus assembly protein PilA
MSTHGAIDTMTSLNPSLRLALINKAKSKQNILQKGFTLVELMIVIVIVGVLSATALPQFLGLKDTAKAGSDMGEFIGLAKECSTAVIIEGPYPAAYPTELIQTGATTPGISGDCDNTAAVDYKTPAFPAATTCGTTAIKASEGCKITVAKDTGLMTYTAYTPS